MILMMLVPGRANRACRRDSGFVNQCGAIVASIRVGCRFQRRRTLEKQ